MRVQCVVYACACVCSVVYVQRVVCVYGVCHACMTCMHAYVHAAATVHVHVVCVFAVHACSAQYTFFHVHAVFLYYLLIVGILSIC